MRRHQPKMQNSLAAEKLSFSEMLEGGVLTRGGGGCWSVGTCQTTLVLLDGGGQVGVKFGFWLTAGFSATHVMSTVMRRGEEQRGVD